MHVHVYNCLVQPRVGGRSDPIGVWDRGNEALGHIHTNPFLPLFCSKMYSPPSFLTFLLFFFSPANNSTYGGIRFLGDPYT